MKKKNTVLALFKWAKTSLVPLAETTSVTVHEDRVSPWWPPLVLSTFLGLYAFFIGAPVFAAIYIMRIRRHFRKVLTFTITPGKRYKMKSSPWRRCNRTSHIFFTRLPCAGGLFVSYPDCFSQPFLV